MRRLRWVLLGAIVVGLVVVGEAWRAQRERTPAAAPKSEPLPGNVKSVASDWKWSHNVGARTVVEVRARNFVQVEDRFDLEGVDLRLYHPDGKTFDHVRSAQARFDVRAGTLYSEGEVEITMGVPLDAARRGRLVAIRSSGVSFESKTGKVSTERGASFVFDQGEGTASGAAYDPETRELRLRSNVDLVWRGRGGRTPPMRIEGGELTYREKESKIFLAPWSRLTRGTLRVEAGASVVTLRDGVLELVEAPRANGADRQPQREIAFGADSVEMRFDKDGEITRIVGSGGARLESKAATGLTNVQSERIDLDFEPGKNESILRKALATGNALVESHPVPRAGVPAPDTRRLSADVVDLRMRDGGREIDGVETHAPGWIEFVPNRAGQRRRRMDSERMQLVYGEENRVRSLRAVRVSTRSSGLATKARPSPPDTLTSSVNLQAVFHPKTGELATLEQWDDFKYEEGARKARANRAALDSATNRMTLEGSARVSDETGTANADHIALDQNTGDYDARGHVRSTRLPDQKGGSPSLLARGQAVQGSSEHLVSSGGGQVIRYEGAAVLWQGANRLEADTIEIDRQSKKLQARGHVVSRFADQRGGDAKPPRPSAPVFTIVRAPALTYSDGDRLADYQGGALLARPGMDVRAERIRAYLRAGENGSSLERALADGAVEIDQKSADRTRRGSGEHAVYEVGEEKVTLEGGAPQLVDSVRGTTRGDQLTWFSRDDRLLVNGRLSQPAVSRVLRK